jgi:hypothetical protein
MKAIKDCEWRVNIEIVAYCTGRTSFCRWTAMSVCSKIIGRTCSNHNKAKADFIEFAALNGITNYKFVEE